MSDEKLFPTCEAVGHCPRPTIEAAPFHYFYWDDGKGGKGHADPLSNYGAVKCKTCGLQALVLQDADDFPEL